MGAAQHRPRVAHPATLLSLQRAAGNVAVTRLLECQGGRPVSVIQRQPAPAAPPPAAAGPSAPGPASPGPSGAEAQALIRQWLEQHQVAPPEQQPDQGERHVLLNGEDMALSQAVQVAADALHQPPDVVRDVIVTTLAPAGPASPLRTGSLLPGLPGLGTPSGGIDPAIGKVLDLETIDSWLAEHRFSPPEIRDPAGDRVLLDGQETTIEQVADRALAIVGGDPSQMIRVAYVTRQDVLVHLRQRYVAARGGPSTQIVVGYTLVPRALQVVTGPPDPANPLRTQHQFSFTITRAHHAGDSPGLESSFQGSIAFNDAGDIVSLQAGGQEAVVDPLLRGWIQVSGFVQTMASANWSRSASGSVTVAPAVQTSAGAQVLVTPTFRGGPFSFLNGHVQLGVQGMAGVQVSPQGAQAGASAGLILNIPF
jgi:hypothetical protein